MTAGRGGEDGEARVRRHTPGVQRLLHTALLVAKGRTQRLHVAAQGSCLALRLAMSALTAQ